MPIEIRELVIRTVVGGQAVAGGPEGDAPDPPAAGGGAADSDEIVQACVREVLRVLTQGRER